PRTNILADVATENVVPHAGAKVLGDRPPFFNGEIGDALVGIELVRSENRVDRAGVDVAAGGERRRLLVRHRLAESGFDLLQTMQDRVVIVLAAPGIARNPTAAGIVSLRRVRILCVVVDRTNDHASCPRRSGGERSPFESTM